MSSKWTTFMVDFNSLGFYTFETEQQFRDWVAKARKSRDWRGDDFVLDAKVAGKEHVAAVEIGARITTPGPLGYGLDPDIPTFGYRREHRGSYTLREWLRVRSIEWPKLDPSDCLGCFNCLDDPEMGTQNPTNLRMILCPECGNKRCPKATDHRHDCTGSNEPGQPGSRYRSASENRE
jgi:hypothetical protein